MSLRNQTRTISQCIMLLMLLLIWPTPSPAITGLDAPSLKQVLEDEESTESDKQQSAAKKKPLILLQDELGRDNPYSSTMGFLNVTRERDYSRAAEYLDLRYLPDTLKSISGADLARQLKIILDRTLWIDFSLLSEDTKGHMDDGLPAYRDYVGSIELGGRKIDILLQRVPQDNGIAIWQFSNASVRHIPDLYAKYGYGPIGERLSRSLPEFELLGFQSWQWIILFGLVLLAYLIAFLPTWLLGILVRRSRLTLATPLAAFITKPLRLIITVLLVRFWIDVIHPSIEARALLRGQTLLILVSTWAVFHVIGIIHQYWVQRMRVTDREQAIVLLQPIATAAKIVAALFAALLWLDNIGFSVTTLLAGLGIGGIAVALAAQKSIENLIGAITLYMAAPVRVGDFCRFGDKLGTVEEIGLRSTRIRTLDQTVINIPNRDFAGLPLENFANRERYRFAPTIGLRYGTTPDQIRYILVELHRLLYAHPKVDPPPVQVRFASFGVYSLDINVFTYIKTSDYGDFLEVSEDLNLRIMDIISAAGSDFALPAQELYLGKVQQLDEDAARKAASQVAQWRENDLPPYPNLSEEEIERIKGSLQQSHTNER